MVQPTFELSLKPLQLESRLILCFPWAIASSPEGQILCSPHVSLLSGKHTHPMGSCLLDWSSPINISKSWSPDESSSLSPTPETPPVLVTLSDWHYHTCLFWPKSWLSSLIRPSPLHPPYSLCPSHLSLWLPLPHSPFCLSWEGCNRLLHLYPSVIWDSLTNLFKMQISSCTFLI